MTLQRAVLRFFHFGLFTGTANRRNDFSNRLASTYKGAEGEERWN